MFDSKFGGQWEEGGSVIEYCGWCDQCEGNGQSCCLLPLSLPMSLESRKCAHNATNSDTRPNFWGAATGGVGLVVVYKGDGYVLLYYYFAKGRRLSGVLFTSKNYYYYGLWLQFAGNAFNWGPAPSRHGTRRGFIARERVGIKLSDSTGRWTDRGLLVVDGV